MIIDRCKRKKQPLFLAFIDFSKAYDLVPHCYLMKLLKSLGCGAVMLMALVSMYSLTQFFLGSTIITAALGVKQGSPTSCFLFIVFVDVMIKMVKSVQPDRFLKWLHILMLMDDTVLMASSRERLVEKLQKLVEYCTESGMVINEDKTKFMVICPASPRDRESINIGPVTVHHCTEYTYLGVIFTCDGNLSSMLRAHSKSRKKQMNKLIIFLQANQDAPFSVKKKVVDAAFTSSILYGCEAWLGSKPREMDSMYLEAIKLLLGVRISTKTDVALLEAGYPSLEAAVHGRQKAFLTKMIRERQDMTDDPLMFALELTRQDNKKVNSYIDDVLGSADIIGDDIRQRQQRVRDSNESKSIAYRNINPELQVHPVYA